MGVALALRALTLPNLGCVFEKFYTKPAFCFYLTHEELFSLRFNTFEPIESPRSNDLLLNHEHKRLRPEWDFAGGGRYCSS